MAEEQIIENANVDSNIEPTENAVPSEFPIAGDRDLGGTVPDVPVPSAKTVFTSTGVEEKVEESRTELALEQEKLQEFEVDPEKRLQKAKDFAGVIEKEPETINVVEPKTGQTLKITPDKESELTAQGFVRDVQVTEVEEADSFLDEEAETIAANFDSFIKSSDAASNAAIQNIKNIFEQRRRQQKEINKRVLASLTKIGVRSGRQRHAQSIQTSILSAEERSGIQRLQDLDAQELNLISEATQASDRNEFFLLNQKMSALRDIRSEKRLAVLDQVNIAKAKNDLVFQQLDELRKQSTFERGLTQDRLSKLETISNVGGVPRPGDVSELDAEFGVGFSENFLQTTRELREAKTEEQEQVAAASMAKFLLTIPEGKTIKIGDVEFQGLGEVDEGLQIFREKDAFGNTSFVTVDKGGNIVNVSSTGPTAGPSGTGAPSTGDVPTQPIEEFKPETFEEFISNKEQELAQSIANPEEFRQEFEQKQEEQRTTFNESRAGTPLEKITEADLVNTTPEEDVKITQVMRLLPTKLKDSEQERTDRKVEVLRGIRQGKDIQELVDEIKGFILEPNVSSENKDLALSLRALAAGTGLELSEISAVINLDKPVRAMSIVEKANLDQVQSELKETETARSLVKGANRVLELLKDINVENLGEFDGRKFKIKKFFGQSDEETLKTQQLETAMVNLLNSIRRESLGTQVTDTEVEFLSPLLTDLLDQPKIIETKMNELKVGTLNNHNEARGTVNLPLVNEAQLLDNNLRLNLYRGLGESPVSPDAVDDIDSFLNSF